MSVVGSGPAQVVPSDLFLSARTIISQPTEGQTGQSWWRKRYISASDWYAAFLGSTVGLEGPLLGMPGLLPCPMDWAAVPGPGL